MTPLQPAIIIIFGITGDLSQRKLLPALYHLLKDGLLHEDTVILGITRQTTTAEELLGRVELCVNEIDKVCDPEGLRKVRQALRMHQMELDAGADYDKLRVLIDDIETEKGTCLNRLYYLSVPPKTVEPIVRHLGEHKHTKMCRHGQAESRLLVEKPFGYDLDSARRLIDETTEWFSEHQIYRIDHYVAKETVQNILAFRMSSPVVARIWSREQIAAIEITAYEQITIEGRAVFYEGVGALRDFIQSHLLQLLTVVTMELPDNQQSLAVHAAKQALLKSITPITPDEVADRTVRGQYEGYREEVAKPKTNTETYASLTLDVNNQRWQGVPMTIRTGKAMARKLTEIRIVLKQAGAGGQPAELVFAIQPDEGISLRLNSAQPDFAGDLTAAVNDFNHQQAKDGNRNPGGEGHPDAYERVLLDAARGDHTLFTTSEEVLEAWEIVENVLAVWGDSDDGLIIYPKGSQSVSG